MPCRHRNADLPAPPESLHIEGRNVLIVALVLAGCRDEKKLLTTEDTEITEQGNCINALSLFDFLCVLCALRVLCVCL